MKIIQINTTVNSGSIGRIAEDLGKVLIAHGHESYIAYGRGNRPSSSKLISIGKQIDVYCHGIKTAAFDRHGFGSRHATRELILRIKDIEPDAIVLHNLHGYYINIDILFKYLSENNVPVLWTLFDCWAFTGHCSYFDDINCIKWKTHCETCPKSRAYPSSYLFDSSFRNFNDKKRLFNNAGNLELIVHSRWLAGLVKDSFLKNIKVHVTPSGIDLSVFYPVNSDLYEKYKLQNKKIILGCASIWSKRKGLDDFLNLYKLLPEEYQIVLIGLNQKQIQTLPLGIIGISRTESTNELAEWYSIADVFVNPTYSDNFPTTNIEALACGTPVVTYDTGGSPEAIDDNTGIVVGKGNLVSLHKAIEAITAKGKEYYKNLCRLRAVAMFNKDDRYGDYMNILYDLIKRSV